MPTWLRLFHISKISEHNKKQNEEMEDDTSTIRILDMVYQSRLQPENLFELKNNDIISIYSAPRNKKRCISNKCI